MAGFKLYSLLGGIALLLLGIAGNIYWTRKNENMTKEQCFQTNYWMYIGMIGLGLILVILAGLLYWWASRDGGSSQYGYGLANLDYGIGYFE